MTKYVVLRVTPSGAYESAGVQEAENTEAAVRRAVIGGAPEGHYVAVAERNWHEHKIARVQSFSVEDVSLSVGLSHPEPEPLDISPLLTPQAH